MPVDQIFDNLICKNTAFPKGEYDNCTFKEVDFSNADLRNCKFTECSFISCNLSNTKVTDSGFRDIHFKDCKILGLLFDTCNTFNFSVRFENCVLNHCSFFKVKLKKTVFENCQIHESDFSESDLSFANFSNSDLMGSIFDNTNLEKTDFRTAVHYSLDPEKNKVKKALFSINGLPGLLGKYDLQIED